MNIKRFNGRFNAFLLLSLKAMHFQFFRQSVMNLDPGDSKIYILLINIDSLSLSLSLSFVSLENQHK